MRRRCPASHPRSTLGHPRDIRLALRNRHALRPPVCGARTCSSLAPLAAGQGCTVCQSQGSSTGIMVGALGSLAPYRPGPAGPVGGLVLVRCSLVRSLACKGPRARSVGAVAGSALVLMGALWEPGLWGFGRRQSMCSPAHCSLSSARSGAARPAPRAPARIWARWRRRATRPAAWPGASRRGSWRSNADPGLALVPSAARRRSRVATHHHRPERSRARPRWRRPSCLRRGRGRTVCARAGGSRFGLRGRCHRSAARMARCAAAGRRRPAGPQAGAEPDGIGAHKHSLGYRWG